MPQGIALDLMQARGMEHHTRQIVGTNDYTDTVGSDVVVITAGSPRKPGMSRDDLLKINALIVVEAAQKAIAHSPDALLIVVTNPLDVVTYLAWQTTNLPPRRVMGMAGILDSARFQTFIAMELGVCVADVTAVVLGGHGDLMVPLPRYSTVSGIPITELMDASTIERLIERTRNGGAEIVELMRTGGAYFAPASSTCLMVEAILHNQLRQVPAAAYLQGEYGLNDIFIGVPTRVGVAASKVCWNLTSPMLNALLSKYLLNQFAKIFSGHRNAGQLLRHSKFKEITLNTTIPVTNQTTLLYSVAVHQQRRGQEVALLLHQTRPAIAVVGTQKLFAPSDQLANPSEFHT
jgi:malate dehydrogenase